MRNKTKFKLNVHNKGIIYANSLVGVVWKVITNKYDRKYYANNNNSSKG